MQSFLKDKRIALLPVSGRGSDKRKHVILTATAQQRARAASVLQSLIRNKLMTATAIKQRARHPCPIETANTVIVFIRIIFVRLTLLVDSASTVVIDDRIVDDVVATGGDGEDGGVGVSDTSSF